MKTLNALKLRIMTRAFKIRIAAGEVFEDIAADYPSLTTDNLEAIKAELEKTNNVDAAAYLGVSDGKDHHGREPPSGRHRLGKGQGVRQNRRRIQEG